MKVPVCDKDIKTGEFCEKCSEKADSLGLKKLDLRALRALEKVEKNFSPLEIEYVKTLDLCDLLVLVGKGRIGALIGKKGRIVRELSRLMEKKVRVVEHTKDHKKMVQDLVGDVRVLGVNQLFGEEKELTEVLISRADTEKLICGQEELEKALQELLQTETRIRLV